MPFKSYTTHDDGTTSFEREDGTWTPKMPPVGATYLEKKRVDLRLAENGGAPGFDVPGLAAPISGDQGSGTRREVPPPSMLDAGGSSGGAPPIYTPAEPPVLESRQPMEPAGAGGAPGVSTPQEAPPDGGGGAQGAPSTGGPDNPAPALPVTAPAAGAPGKVDPSTLVSAKPAVPRGGGGGGGAPAGPREILAGRQVSIEGKLSPETQAMQEGIIRRQAELEGRATARGEERAALERDQEDILDREAKRHDDELARLRQEQQRMLEDLDNQRQAKLKEIEEGKINPNKFWEDRGTGGQIAAALAIGLGGFFSAMGGNKTPNTALEIINKAVDRDIDLQEKNLGKKQWEASELGRLYIQTKERTGDRILARNEAKIVGLAKMSAQAKRLAAMSNNEDMAIKANQIQLKADAQIADLRARNEDRIKEVRQYKTVMPGGGGAPKKKPTQGFVIRDPKSGKDRFVEFPPGLSEGQKNDVFKRVQGINNAQRTLGRLQKAKGLGLPVADGDAQAFAQSFTYEYAEGKGQGQATADQEKSVAAKVSGPLGYKAIEAYAQNLDDSAEELIRQFSNREEE